MAGFQVEFLFQGFQEGTKKVDKKRVGTPNPITQLGGDKSRKDQGPGPVGFSRRIDLANGIIYFLSGISKRQCPGVKIDPGNCVNKGVTQDFCRNPGFGLRR
ncbi:MAG: hypothetical protein Ct9H300mP16_14150 [Pseudomonadota bacterium]|nr:MAG: hypothetical protein Ct9H300mP16_14150 [Pseudomonadota bacterium]